MNRITKSAFLIVAGMCAQTAVACNTIQSGAITDTAGNPVRLGFDKYGYNYQAHIFNGLYENFSRPAEPVTESNVTLQMKWSDTWLSNKDCNTDGKLDRGLGGSGPSGTSQGWLTNHEQGSYEGTDGQIHHYSYFVKIVYMPTGCEAANQIWGSYCIIEEISNDPAGGMYGKYRNRVVHPGLGVMTN